MPKFLNKSRLLGLVELSNIVYKQDIDLNDIAHLSESFNYPVVSYTENAEGIVVADIAINERADTFKLMMDISDFNDLPEMPD